MKKKCLLIQSLMILLIMTSCRVSEVELKQGEKMIEITKDDTIVFQEAHIIDSTSYVGKTLAAYIAGLYHDDIKLLERSKIVYDLSGVEVDLEDVGGQKTSKIISFAKHDVKNASLYVHVPGEILYVMTTDSEMEFERINASTVVILDWNNENSAELVYIEGKYDKIGIHDSNYVLYDYTKISDHVYKETISIDLGEYGDVIMSVEEWLKENTFSSYEEMQERYQFKEVIKQKVASVQDLERKNKDNITYLGKINSNTYLRMPKDILMVSEGVKYEIIDAKTILVKDGRVTLIYK